MAREVKNKIVVFVIAALIVVVVVLFIFNRPKDDLEALKADYTIHIEDTASITKIIISDKTPKSVTLVRTKNGWETESGNPVRLDAIQTLLETLNRVRLKNFVPETARDNVLRRMASAGKEVKVYAGNKLIRHFYVGTETMDEMGTYMMLKDGKNPYAMFIPGFNGFLSTRFFANEALWLRKTIWAFDNLDISKVEYKDFDTPENSFTLTIDNGYQLTNATGQPLKADSIKAAVFLAGFRTVEYEGVILPEDPIYKRQDSLKASIPAFELTAWKRDGSWKKLTTYHIKANEDAVEFYTNLGKYDPDRLHAFISNDKGQELFVLVQYYGLAPVLVTVHDLKKR
ncbi:hypothetical protein JCM31826_00640 [Thermaurantimonas aggregans]|uniref:Uncharacterized protein n=1 Tax=Thermaurantimonas aggregans TaxID=2173829 RepID=A0A401XHU9_9FLAO|nr:hypothetical protein JCM31826_00640 [Thermaurantimonas aggregans]